MFHECGERASRHHLSAALQHLTNSWLQRRKRAGAHDHDHDALIGVRPVFI